MPVTYVYQRAQVYVGARDTASAGRVVHNVNDRELCRAWDRSVKRGEESNPCREPAKSVGKIKNSSAVNVAVSRVVRDRAGAVIHRETYTSAYTLWNGRIEIGR